MKHRTFQRNLQGADYIVGDVHGRFDHLAEALKQIDFSIRFDRLFIAGDLGDRGPFSRDALWWLVQPWCHAVRGNHDQVLIDYQKAVLAGLGYVLHCGRKFDEDRIIANGGKWFVGMEDDVRQRYADAFDTLPIAITLETKRGSVGLVHAEAPIGATWQGFLFDLEAEDADGPAERSALIGRLRIEKGVTTHVDGVRAVVVGHSTVQAPCRLGNHIFIDTGAVYRDHSFTILDAETLAPMLLAPRKMEDPKRTAG